MKPAGDNDESNIRTLHHNMLFPIQSAQEEPEQVDIPPPHSNVALQKANLLMDAYFDSCWINMLGWYIFEGGTRVAKK